MQLREHTIYFRASTYEDLFDSGKIIEVVDAIETLLGDWFVASQDLGRARQRPGVARPGRVVLDESCGRGLHLATRVKLLGGPAEDPENGPSLEINAGGHPYSGRFLTSLDLRVPKARFENPDFLSLYVAWVEAVAEQISPFMVHCHDTDDTSIQNLGSRALLRSGFGIEVEEEVDLLSNPGLEVSRGEFRYMATWLMILGEPMVEQIGGEVLEAMETARRVTGDRFVIRLYDSPLDCEAPENREKQRRAREQLRLAEISKENSWAWGYWDRKKRS